VPALASVLVVATAAAGGSGMLSPGDVILGAEPTGPPENRQGMDETVLATGTTPIAGPWRITGYKSDGAIANGEVVEPAGLPCVRLMLSAPPEGTPYGGRGFCGERGQDLAHRPLTDA
jgi:hypothetical protein